MKKRVLSLFMTLMLCLTSLPTTSFAEELVVANGTSTVEAVDGEGKSDAGEAEAGAESGKSGKTGEAEAGAESGKTGEAEAGAETGMDGKAESGAENAMDEAVASVQDMIDALPEADTLSAMDENEVLAAYMAVQAAYDAYEALTAEQQAQVMGADCFEELFGWFNGQVAPLAYNDNKDRLSGTVIEGTNLSLEWCDHDDATYKSSGDTQHKKKCAQCGFEGEAYDCGTDGIDGYVSGGDNGHYKQCPCGNTFGDLIPHVPSYLLTNNNTMHVSGCNDCGYTNGEEGTHIFPEGETEEYPLGECTVCGFAPVAESKGSALYDSVTEALETIANDNNGADDYVRLNLSSYTHGVKQKSKKRLNLTIRTKRLNCR